MVFHPEFRSLSAILLGIVLATPTMAASARPILRSESFQLARQLRFPLDNVQSSSGRTGGFARQGECSNLSDTPHPVALTPVVVTEQINGGSVTEVEELVLAKTTDAHPSFYIFVPNIEVRTAYLDLLDEDGEVLMDLEISLPSEAGIVPIEVPESAPPLELGKTYFWTFVLPCYVGEERLPALEAQGWIQRVTPETEVVEQVNQAEPRDRPSLYANANLWYDTLTTLADLRYENPADPQLQESWQSLLDSVNLGAIANEPLLAAEGVNVELIEVPTFDFDN